VQQRASKILSVKDQIAEQLRSDIISGELPPNTKLNEKSLAERFSLSRGPIRDVILQLTKEGLLVSKNNCGASVNNLLEPKLQKLMIKLRRDIELYALEQLKNVLIEEDFQALESILQDLQTAFNNKNDIDIIKSDISFHYYLIYKAGGDELINVWYPYIMRMRLNYKPLTSPSVCISEHQKIIDALRKKDTAKAAKALKNNIK